MFLFIRNPALGGALFQAASILTRPIHKIIIKKTKYIAGNVNQSRH
jgi:hypothetical protein